MLKRILSDQNRSKAIEIRLESDGNRTYHVIIAGMTVKMMGACVRGVCEPTGENEYLEHESETYFTATFSDYSVAREKYDLFKTRYVD